MGNTVMPRNLPKRRAAFFAELVARDDVVASDYTRGFRSFIVARDHQEELPAWIRAKASNLGYTVSRMTPSVHRFDEETSRGELEE